MLAASIYLTACCVAPRVWLSYRDGGAARIPIRSRSGTTQIQATHHTPPSPFSPFPSPINKLPRRSITRTVDIFIFFLTYLGIFFDAVDYTDNPNHCLCVSAGRTGFGSASLGWKYLIGSVACVTPRTMRTPDNTAPKTADHRGLWPTSRLCLALSVSVWQKRKQSTGGFSLSRVCFLCSVAADQV